MDNIKKGYTRVSSILSQWDRFGHIDEDVLRRKSDLGTAVHEAIAADGQDITIPLSHAQMGYFISYTRWRDIVKPYQKHIELRLYCDKLKITGAVDALIEIGDSKELILLDYKTSASEDAKIWPLQGVFYHYLAKVNGYAPSNQIIFLKLDKTGCMPKACNYQYSDELFNVCMSALTCYRYRQKD